MEERAQKIVDAAMELANEGGFEGVRLRELAAKSGVAFGTLYSRFNSKEDILIAALEQEAGKFRELLRSNPIEEGTPLQRCEPFFRLLSRTLLDRRGFATAVLRAVSSGAGVAEKIIRYQDMMNEIIVRAIWGDAVYDSDTEEREEVIFAARMMQNIWFAELISWMSDAATEEQVVNRTVRCARLFIRALDLGRLEELAPQEDDVELAAPEG
jgi:AcrR family transcriptional regulator